MAQETTFGNYPNYRQCTSSTHLSCPLSNLNACPPNTMPVCQFDLRASYKRNLFRDPESEADSG